MNMKGNSLALASFFVLLFVTLSLGTTPAYAITLRENVTGHAYIHGAAATYELTVPAAQVTNYADMFDFQKGAHYTMPLSEGKSLHISAIVTNNMGQIITVEATGYMRIKATPEDSWSTIWSDSIKGDIDVYKSFTASADPIDATQFGWWQQGCQTHFCIGFKVYPKSNPSDWTYSAFSIWFMVGKTTTTTPPPGDGTTTTPGTPPEYSYEGTLAFLDPLAQALGVPRIGVVVIIAVVLMCLFGGLVHVLTKDEEY